MALELTEYQYGVISKIKQIRMDMGMTQVHLSALLGISTGQLGNIESPKFTHKYTLKQIYTICERFEIPIENIFLDEDYDKSVNADERIHQLVEKIVEYEG